MDNVNCKKEMMDLLETWAEKYDVPNEAIDELNKILSHTYGRFFLKEVKTGIEELMKDLEYDPMEATG